MHEERIAGMIPTLTWEGLIKDIVKKENMDPWDIDIEDLTANFFRGIEDRDIVLYGKMLLTASLLLRMKSEMMGEEYEYYLSHLAGAIDLKQVFDMPDVRIYPKLTPPRKRKVTVDELVSALRGAMDVEDRRKKRRMDREKSLKIREMFKSVNIEEKIRALYSKVADFFRKMGRDRVSFFELSQSRTRDDVIWTFVPLLHLASQGKIEMVQEEPFGEIYVKKAD